MKQINSDDRKSMSLMTLFFGYTLIGIAGYIVYKFATFIFDQIDLPANITNLGLASSLIMATLAGTAILLRMDMKQSRKHLPYPQKVVWHK